MVYGAHSKRKVPDVPAGGFSVDLTHHMMHAVGSRTFGYTRELFEDPQNVEAEARAPLPREVAEGHPYTAELVLAISHDPNSVVGVGSGDQFEPIGGGLSCAAFSLFATPSRRVTALGFSIRNGRKYIISNNIAWTCSVARTVAVRRDFQQRQLAEDGLAAEEEGVGATKVASTAAPISSLKYGALPRRRRARRPDLR
jgi:hypothetical protein